MAKKFQNIDRLCLGGVCKILQNRKRPYKFNNQPKVIEFIYDVVGLSYIGNEKQANELFHEDCVVPNELREPLKPEREDIHCKEISKKISELSGYFSEEKAAKDMYDFLKDEVAGLSRDEIEGYRKIYENSSEDYFLFLAKMIFCVIVKIENKRSNLPENNLEHISLISRTKKYIDNNQFYENYTREIYIKPDTSKQVFYIENRLYTEQRFLNEVDDTEYFTMRINYKTEEEASRCFYKILIINGVDYTERWNASRKIEQRDPRRFKYPVSVLFRIKDVAKASLYKIEKIRHTKQEFPILTLESLQKYPSKLLKMVINLEGEDINDFKLVFKHFTPFYSELKNENKYERFATDASINLMISDWTLPGSGYFLLAYPKNGAIENQTNDL